MTSNVILFEDRCECQAKLPREFDVLTSRIALIGNSTVGKTCLVGSWITGHSVLHDVAETGEHEEDLYHKIIEYGALTKSSNLKEYRELLERSDLDDRPEVKQNKYRTKVHSEVRNEIYDSTLKLDTQVIDVTDFDVTDYSDIRNLQLNQADGFILCFDTTNPATLADMLLYHRIITRQKGDDVPIIVCGNKIDCVHERKVSEDEAIGICEEMGVDFDTAYFETSAMENINVSEVFYAILSLIEKQRPIKVRESECNHPKCHNSSGSSEKSSEDMKKSNGYPETPSLSGALKDSESTVVSVPELNRTMEQISSSSVLTPALIEAAPAKETDEKAETKKVEGLQRHSTEHSTRTIEKRLSRSEKSFDRTSTSQKNISSRNTCCIIC
ncbi:unnamed protein product [Kluyveromyces dobzhanskii CBS 2104]|uniref:WGS project CCBQ000000000 data, contig 00014 n=1 Tax=Kluyveromyces dobzhanskii CBS 2104 TaxID=1427455 RepID=A0A0A8L965_9SACH|nr:unnamed protein product [Kluyveromyces dobzhanskii CBS 2104]